MVGRMMLMNSEFAYDTGRLPQPWVIPLGVVAIVVSHLLFRGAMRRYTRGAPAYGPSVARVVGHLARVAWGAYNWPGPIQVGRHVGPHSGQSAPWDLFVWVAYYAVVAPWPRDARHRGPVALRGIRRSSSCCAPSAGAATNGSSGGGCARGVLDVVPDSRDQRGLTRDQG